MTDAGLERLRAGDQGWKNAQREFAAAFGDERTLGLRALLREVAATDLPFEVRRGRLNDKRNPKLSSSAI